MWYTIITMTSVGYGDIYAVTPPGRYVALLAALLGEAYVSLLVALISSWLTLEEKEGLSMQKIKEQQASARSICAAL